MESQYIKECVCCGSKNIILSAVLWESLINEWQISTQEADYINQQQGLHCSDCNSNLRTMVLATSIMKSFNYKGVFKDFVKEDNIKNLKVLEINEAGFLTSFLSQISGHTLKLYPEIDIMNIDYPDMYFDIVIHSDVLEHIQYPLRALSECYRILKTGGFCAFTVPMIVDRLTRSREGLSPSYHGSGEDFSGFLVYSEYGCDVWKQIIQGGFQECRLHSLNYPAAQAWVGVK
ncbi:class I SAM-dependent methyltransferase [Nodularia chucula]|uniref:class I SAM-dependent methyltransferase n=1 Tax=Nodularia chucula TaxID=3093667 RepID=UPI0039C67A12